MLNGLRYCISSNIIDKNIDKAIKMLHSCNNLLIILFVAEIILPAEKRNVLSLAINTTRKHLKTKKKKIKNKNTDK